MKAIDVHAHIPTRPGVESLMNYQRLLVKYYLKLDLGDEEIVAFAKDEDAVAEDFRAAGVKAFLVGWDAEHSTGSPPLPNDYLRDVAARNPDVILGVFGGVDPGRGEKAIVEAERCVREYDFLGLKFHPPAQGFRPNDPACYPLWEACSDWGAIVQFHTGTTALGAGAPGGGGIHLEFGRPVYVDDVAADFPDLKIVVCHPGWPWAEENLMLLLHKANVFMDLSGWAPRHFPDPLKREIKGRLREKVMFGSDYPLVSYEQLFSEYEAMEIPEDVLERIYFRNAVEILGIDEARL